MAQKKNTPGRPSGTKNKKKQDAAKKKMDKRLTKEIWGVIFIAIGIFLFAAVQFHAAGTVGNTLGEGLRGIFGVIGLVLPWYLVLFGVLIFADKNAGFTGKISVLVLMILLLLCLLNSGRFIDSENLVFDGVEFYKDGVALEGGGVFGMVLGTLLIQIIGKVGLYVFATVAVLIGVLVMFDTPAAKAFEKLADKVEERRAEREALAEMEEQNLAETDADDVPSGAAAKRSKRNAERAKKEEQMELDFSAPASAASSKPEKPEPAAEKRRELKIITPYDDAGPLGRDADAGNEADREAVKDLFRHAESEKKAEKNSVLQYMSDGDLFSGADDFGEKKKSPKDKTEDKKEDKPKSYGLDGGSTIREGYGLDGKPAKKGSGQFGFEAPSVPLPGYGLDGAALSVEGTQHAQHADSFVRASDVSSKSGVLDVPGVIAKEPELKLSKKEAASITLNPEEMAQTAKVPVKYHKPPISLLNKPQIKNRGNLNADLKAKAVKLEETLKNFNVDARVIQVTQGPAVTRYEIQPNVGVKVNSIVRLSDDIALNLEAKSIRIEAPIPGKAAVGIEVENDKINMVTLREIIDSNEFKEAKSKITFAVGKDIAGKAIVADLKGMPHLLIAGSTGSGKSVCINSIITSILYKADPDEVKLVLIDPKVVELGNYNGIPHLLIPVVTEPTKAAAALNWAVAEMTDRYKKFAEAGVRDLESYNEHCRKSSEDEQVMPQIVIIIDELADLMMAAPSQVEESICRLAQMARAAGMHLIVATQRPSVDIITGVIKANIPSRIAFAVSSQFDSRTILDMSGAEKLVGKGDMLFNPLGMGKPVRVQGTFVSDDEVHDVIQHVKSQVQDVEYSGDVINTIEKGNIQESKDDDGDELLPEAIECVVTAGQASVSMLQRRFRIGYNRAARIVDMMEARGIVGPQDGSRPRQVLLTEDELAAMKNEVETE